VARVKLQSDRKMNNANPEWTALEQMRVCATLRELWNERFEFEIFHHPKGGRPPVIIGTASVYLRGLIHSSAFLIIMHSWDWMVCYYYSCQ
jgi:hypothetical protein